MAMLIAPNGPSRDALLAALEGGDARSVSPDHDDFFSPALNAGAIVYAPGPPADPDRMRRVLGACNAPGVTLIVFVRPPDDSFEPEETLLRRDGKPYVVLAAPPGSPALGPGLRRALSEGELQGRVLDLTAPAPEAAGGEGAPARSASGRGDAAPDRDGAAPDRDGAAKRAAAAPGPGGAPSERPDAPSKREPSPAGSGAASERPGASSKRERSPAGSGAAPGRPAARNDSPSPKAASSNDPSPERAALPSDARPAPAAAWPRWLLPAAAAALLVALQAMGVRVLPAGCSVPAGAETAAPAPR